MFRPTFFALVLLLSSVSSSSLLKKSLVRRQSDAQPCQAIQGFECKCTYYRVTCTTEQELPGKLTVLPNEQGKYQSVELVISAAREVSASEQTFEPVKQLYKPDGDNLEFRVKFEKFTGLQLTSPGIFNRVFPENLPGNARKHVALEIYNPEVQPHDNVNLFQNLNVESLELYALYPFRGSFQQLFNGAQINYLRLSGGDIRSDASQSFSGNIARLELAKQASALSVQNFPVYPAHELIINAFYLSEFDHPHPPNYNNLGELRVHTLGAIPANAFRQFPNLHTLSLSAEQGVDPQALAGLSKLEKLTVKDGKLDPALLSALPNLKELEASVEKLDEKAQCQLLEKLASGQLAVQALPNGRECTCVSAYLDAAAGRTACDAQNCDRASCAAIKNNYDPNTRTFKAPPAILRADGSNALQQRSPRVYQTPFQISRQDQEKLQQGAPQQVQQPVDQSQGQYPSQDTYEQQYPSYNPVPAPAVDDDQEEDEEEEPPSPASSTQPSKEQDVTDFDYDQPNPNPPPAPLQPFPAAPSNSQNDEPSEYDEPPNPPPLTTEPSPPLWETSTVAPNPFIDGPNQGQGQDQETNAGTGEENNQGTGEETPAEGGANAGDVEQPDSTAPLEPAYYPDDDEIETSGNGTANATPGKKRGMSWLPIIIIAAIIAGLLLIGLIVLLARKKRAPKDGYNRAETRDTGAQPH